MVVGGSLLFSGWRSAAPCSASPSAGSEEKPRSCFNSLSRFWRWFWNQAFPVPCESRPDTAPCGEAHTAPPLPLPGPGGTDTAPAPSAARERPSPGPAPHGFVWAGLPPLRVSRREFEGCAVPVRAGTGRCFRLLSSLSSTPVSREQCCPSCIIGSDLLELQNLSFFFFSFFFPQIITTLFGLLLWLL